MPSGGGRMPRAISRHWFEAAVWTPPQMPEAVELTSPASRRPRSARSASYPRKNVATLAASETRRLSRAADATPARNRKPTRALAW